MTQPNELADKVWLYENHEWSLTDDPLNWGEEGGVLSAKYAEAGYTEMPLDNGSAFPFLSFGLNSEQARPAACFTLYVRDAHPQCVIDIEGTTGSTRMVYAASLPDGLDLMARWAPIAQATALTAIAMDLFDPSESHHLVESLARRVLNIVS